ncbi:MAG: hypothetical protein E7294_12765 [Lachnospiraceae bacterium]|jgi:hypothetical protein|nr:hypothetical protein [Lachnospiraceae bacterium]
MYVNEYRNPDWDRISHLFKIGIFASLLALVGGDMLLGWGTADMSLSGMEQYFSRYLTVSDIRILWSGLLGMTGITLETMCFFGVYRIIASVSDSYAHVYRAGLIGMLAFGSFCHVMCCATIYYHNALYRIDPGITIEETMKFAKYFLIPVSGIFFVFFLVMNIAQIMAFAKGKTPYPKWCFIFTMLIGFADIAAMRLVGNRSWAYALSTGWLSFGSLVTFTGLLINMPKERK